MEPAALRKRMRSLGDELERIGEGAASGDLGGDGAFSGWRRGAPIKLGLRHRSFDDGVLVHRDGPSAGPWRVAERGRNMGETGAFLGPGVNRKTGMTARTKSGAVRKVRATRGRRWNGTTRGKGTWSKASGAIAGAAPKRLTKLNRDAIAKAFGGR